MTQTSIAELLDWRRANPAIDLLVRTTTALRTDSCFVQRETDLLGGEFLAEESEVVMEAGALDEVLSRIDAAQALDARAVAAEGREPMSAELAALPSPLREAALEALVDDRWRLGGLGIRRLILGESGEAQAELMRIEPGYGTPTHDHSAEELTLVVTGAYEDGHARYKAGDLTVAEPGFAHAPTAQPGDICYVLAVTYGPPRFLGAFGGLQRLLGFPWSPSARRQLR